MWLAAWSVSGQTSISGDWPISGRDAGGTRYSPLTGITPENVGRLTRAWTYHTGDQGTQFETTPIVVGGVMYFTTQRQRVVALDAETGTERWAYDPKVPGSREHRGVAYWPGDAGVAPRIVFGTGDGRLIALDANTGRPAAGFGVDGVVDLTAGISGTVGGRSLSVTSPPAIFRNLVIVGPSTPEGPSRGPSGDPRAFDVRTGALVWRFHLIPQPGEPGNDTWGPDGWKSRSGPSLWAGMTVDAERGLVFLPTGNPADSFYGADRKGTNLYANSRRRARGGDRQLPLALPGRAPRHLRLRRAGAADADRRGEGRPAHPRGGPDHEDGPAVPARSRDRPADLRRRGAAGAGERRARRGSLADAAVPAQAGSAGAHVDDARRSQQADAGRREVLHRAVRLAGRRAASTRRSGRRRRSSFPGAMGGGNWGGVSFDPRLGYVFVNTSNLGAIGQMVPADAGAPMPYRNAAGYMRFLDQERFPCQQPPWGELTAVDVNTGDIAWKVPLGSFPELEAQGLKGWGAPNVGGTLATASRLIFVAATNDARLRAFDSRTGRELWAGVLDATGNANPITYTGPSGRQFVAIAAGGPAHLRMVGNGANDRADSLIAFALSDGPAAAPTAAAAPKPAPLASRTMGRVLAPDELPADTGRDLVLRTCSGCHAVQAFSGARLNVTEWELMVADMRLRGARATDDEARTVVSYLAKHLAR